VENKESLDIQYMRTKLLKADGAEGGDNIYSERFPLEHLVDNVCQKLNLSEIWMLEIRRLLAYRYGKASETAVDPEIVYRMVRDEFKRLDEIRNFNEQKDLSIVMTGNLKGEDLSDEEVSVIRHVLDRCYDGDFYYIVVGKSKEDVGG